MTVVPYLIVWTLVSIPACHGRRHGEEKAKEVRERLPTNLEYLPGMIDEWYLPPAISCTKAQKQYFHTWRGPNGGQSPYSRAYSNPNGKVTRNRAANGNSNGNGNGNRRHKRDTGDEQVRVVRKEIRVMTDKERQVFYDTLADMKENMVGEMNEFDIFVSQHRAADAPSAHFGCAFLPWHRQFLFSLERAMQRFSWQRHGQSVALPYWDSTLDHSLPNPSDSVFFHDELMGTASGRVSSGPFANWDSGVQGCEGSLQRLVTTEPSWAKDMLMTDEKIDFVLSKRQFKDIAGFIGNPPGKFEDDHGGCHMFIGGHMIDISCAPSDPIFWLHHAFIDSIWEAFRQYSQETDREREYPTELDGDIGGYDHGPYAHMAPFRFAGDTEGSEVDMPNIQGLNNSYTRDYYEYAARPKECDQHSDCQSRYLWCMDNIRCASKVREGGNCHGLPDEACYGDGIVCKDGRCSEEEEKKKKKKQKAASATLR